MLLRVFPRVVRVGCPEKVVPHIIKCEYSLPYSPGNRGRSRFETPGVGTKTSKKKSVAAPMMASTSLVTLVTLSGNYC